MENIPWCEKYRPEKIDDCILPDNIINQFKSFLREGFIPNLILNGPPGVGKTSIAVACLKEFGCDYIKINSSLKKGIDTIREEVLQFASTVSFVGKKKYIIFDEADGLTGSAQDSLKAFIEEFYENCGFIFTCNNITKINSPIQSRCQIINFNINRNDFVVLGKMFYERIEKILNENDISFDKKPIFLIIKKYYPDWRKILIILQSYYITNKEINSGILSNKEYESYSDLITFLKNKDWYEIRKWTGENSHLSDDFVEFGKKLIKQLEIYINSSCVSVLYLRLNEYDFQHHFVIDKEINLLAFLTKIMNEITFKA